MTYPFELPALPYAYNALEPVIDARTMEFHHDKHHATYVNNLNNAVKDAADLHGKDLTTILKNLTTVPEAIRTAVKNNGGGVYNHNLFWEVMTPGGSKVPTGALAQAINDSFGSFEAFQEKFNAAATTRFGSGWAWLVLDSEKKLQVYSTANQDCPLSEGHTPLLLLDVWEHAYYLQYQNRRVDYIKAFWSIVNWDVVQQKFNG